MTGDGQARICERHGAKFPRAYSATGNRTKPNRTEAMRRNPSHMPTGRLQSLRLFSTLLAEAAGNQATPLVIADSIAQAGKCCCFLRTAMTTYASASSR